MFKNKYGHTPQSIPPLQHYLHSPSLQRDKEGDKTLAQDRTYSHLASPSPCRPSDPLNDTKRSLHQAIEMLQSKRMLNRQAIQQVRSVNHQIATSISTITPVKVSRYYYKDHTPLDNPSKNITPRSHFEWDQEGQGNNHKDMDLTHENLSIRTQLNEQMKRNNEMIRYIKYLQSENQALRSSHSNFPDPQISSLMQENTYLKQQLAASQAQNQHLKKDLQAEVQRLKLQSSELRRDTVRLMRMKHSQ